ncbi:MAG: signal peptidase II [Desulfovibrio sp.]|nr:signal peptidase II [Desulfovibrio sp.]
MKREYAILLVAAATVLGLDQLTKWIARSTIEPGEVIVVIPGFFDLVNIRNRGAAFGFLNRSDIEWQFWLFLGATIVACAVIFAIARNIKHQPALALGLGMILGGALGNLIDRVHFRGVVDFLDFYWGDWHWPAFNVADMGICAGAFLACAAAWRRDAGEER